ncbi:NADH:flavin oxidoreductase/NADH oxidase [Pelotalea chapellei]|uniref:NADH:flavin oxidoreductase/NADH oxidase n=1 Tax=Pelotalea chapellei TaxID=44671 RepID=A0ABS5U7T5_9BACT|nr:NADH:flavin oxidoreductase/NADH oxidase [Pelotalea chapellei]MBT1071724.1 NADH:flavin oxidoreductase/NADH oxidase [Pelotalea chapellei]
MSRLFSPLTLRSVTCRNRIFVSPMCMYSSRDGMPTDWHMVHLGSRAVGGAGLVMVEATAVSPEGRISPDDSGLWSDAHAEAFLPITRFMRENGAVAAIQLAHAGRKGSCELPWRGGGPLGAEECGWQPLAPSSLPFTQRHPIPRSLSISDLEEIEEQFRLATRRSLKAGFQVVEIHMAHGYLLHEFLSPLVNHRSDEYGGSLENRMRFPLQITRAVRKEWPEELPLFVRISATDWVEGGWDIEQSVILSRELKKLGVDLIDCSSGFVVPDEPVPYGPGFQVPFAARVRSEAGIATGAVGYITDPAQAETILATGQADAVLLGREMLRDPYWPLHVAPRLRANVPWPDQYNRGK